MRKEQIGPHAVILRGACDSLEEALLSEIQAIAHHSPFRNMSTPRGHIMSVAMTNCGPLGWITDRKGYRYTPIDPLTGSAWPPMPALFTDIANDSAAQAGFHNFTPDACLINRYTDGVKLSLHQDKDEATYDHPIVSVSLGRSAQFTFGGITRTAPKTKYQLHSGDIVVWGGADRLRYHSIDRLIGTPNHPLFEDARYNLTLRRAAT